MSEETLGVGVVKAGKPVSRLRLFTERAGILAIGATLISFQLAAQAQHEADTFNPVADILRKNNLLEATKQDPGVAAVCDLIAQSADDPAFGVQENLTTVFYLCNAVGHPAYAHIPYNDAISQPPAGKTAAAVEQDLRARVDAQIAKVCAGSAAQQETNGPTLNALCAATGQPGYKIS